MHISLIFSVLHEYLFTSIILVLINFLSLCTVCSISLVSYTASYLPFDVFLNVFSTAYWISNLQYLIWPIQQNIWHTDEECRKSRFFFPDYLLLKVKKPWSDLLMLPCTLITGLLIVLRLRYNLPVLCMSGRKEYGGTGSHQYNQSRKYLVNFVLILIDGNCT